MLDTIVAIFSMIVPMTVIIVGGAFLLWGIIGGICGTIENSIEKQKKEKQALLKENLLLRNRQTVYESLFPWLKIVSESNITPDDAVRISAYINEDEDYITFLRKILTMEEYTTLSPAEKFMCAVEHCRKNKPPEK